MKRLNKAHPRLGWFLLFAILATAVIIFLFSCQDGIQSGKTSSRVIQFILNIFYPEYDSLNAAQKAAIIDSMQFYVRKTAHFTEYAILGFFTCSFLRYRDCRKSLSWLIAWLLGTLYAGTDEMHQYIMGTRTGSIRDVCIDSSGVAFGAIAALLIVTLHRRRYARRHRR